MKKLAALAIAVTAALAANTASAALLTQSVVYSDTYSAKTNWTEISLNLPRFNSVLGSLLSVTLDYAGLFSTEFKYENLGRNGRNVVQQVNGDLSFSNLALGNSTLHTLARVDNWVSGRDNAVDYGGTAGYTKTVDATDQASHTWLAGVDDLGAFIGSDAIAFVVSALGSANNGGSGNSRSSINTTAWASVSVTYNFREAVLQPTALPTGNNVPEPASIALLGLALAAAAAGAASRRRGQTPAA